MNWKDIAAVTVIAFLFGLFLTIGVKTVNVIWPDPKHELIVRNVYTTDK